MTCRLKMRYILQVYEFSAVWLTAYGSVVQSVNTGALNVLVCEICWVSICSIS